MIFSLHLGTFNLTKLDLVDVFDKDMLLAAGSLCPLLKEVEFYQRLAHNSSNVHIFTPEELKSIFTKWPAKVFTPYTFKSIELELFFILFFKID